MFNLLRMDLYRVKRTRSVYVCLGVVLLAAVLCFGLLWLLGTPQGREIALRIGMLPAEDLKEASTMLAEVDTLEMYREICMDGGLYCTTLGIWIMLFVCMDYQGGFIKNVMALHQNRWAYLGSKILTAGIVNILYLSAYYLFVLLLNRIFGNMVPYTKPADVLFYIAWTWLLTTAFSALIILVSVWTRSVAAGSLAAVLFGSGIVVMPLYSVLGIFHVGEWLNNTIYLSMAMGPSRYTSLQDLRVFVVGIGFLALYPVITGILLRKQDI